MLSQAAAVAAVEDALPWTSCGLPLNAAVRASQGLPEQEERLHTCFHIRSAARKMGLEESQYESRAVFECRAGLSVQYLTSIHE